MRALLALALASTAAVASAQDPCAGIECSGRGECFEENGRAHCLCDAGYAELSLGCVPSAGEDAALRARRGPGAAARVVALAAREVDRKRWRVGEDATDAIGPLTDYLEPYEWWCGDFVSWIYARAGVPLTGGSAGGWLVTDNRAIAAWHVQRGLFVDRAHPDWATFTPRPGDFVRFRTDRYGHAAIVERVVGDTLHLIEGNVANAVLRGRYPRWRTQRRIEGIGRMALDNAPPHADAGRDLEVVLGACAALAGHVEDDGPEAALEARWTAPEGAFVEAPDALHTRACFAAPGRYELTLHAEDGALRASDTMHVWVTEPPPPVVPEPAPLADPGTGCSTGAGRGAALPAPLALLFFVRRRTGAR